MFQRKIRKQNENIIEGFKWISSFIKDLLEAKYNDINSRFNLSIENDLEKHFSQVIFSSSEKKRFIERYSSIKTKVDGFLQKLQRLQIEPSDSFIRFVNDYPNIEKFLNKHNDETVYRILDTNRDFFDHCLKYPLDYQQRRSIISEEDNCLVVSSAGSGKTSSIIGKVKYLTEVKKVNPERILLISYTNKAASELTERLNTDGLCGYTFHKLALDILGKATGTKPSICEKTDGLFVQVFHKLLENKKFKSGIVQYFVDYQVEEDENEKHYREQREKLSEVKKSRLKVLYPDMDGNTIYVKSEQEKKICFVLSSLGVDFRYEEPYEYSLADETHSQYRPDFSIYYDLEGQKRRIYLEHFGVDEHSMVPEWFAKDKNMTYEEANKKYNDGITWKKVAHEKFGTTLLTTSSADFYYLDVKQKLKALLIKEGVPIKEKTEEELYEMILPPNGKKEKAFIRLVVTFVTLMKSSCQTIPAILEKVKRKDDERAGFIIKNIFKPVYELYSAALAESHQIDFTDVILQATDVCRSSYKVSYDYIIVDEFQDISVDRYNFLKVLREGETHAKLYCVGDDWQSIYRFSGSDMSLFNRFADFFGPTEINKIETTYRFGQPLVDHSAHFIQRNEAQIKKDIHPFNPNMHTDLKFYGYDRSNYGFLIANIISQIPTDKSIFLLGRYSFDDYFLSLTYESVRRGSKFYYKIGGREIEFLTVHKSKGLEADYVILLQCNKDSYGFPSLISDDPVLNYVLTASDEFPFGEERRLFYVAITRAKIETLVLYDKRYPSAFVTEILHPEEDAKDNYVLYRNANKRWTRKADDFLLTLVREGRSVQYISNKMGRSQLSVKMRLKKLNEN